MDTLDHRELDEQLTIERYVAGRLSEEETARFEEHYLECPECLERLELAERFHRALSGVAAEEAALVVKRGLLAALVRLARSRAAPWLAAALLAVLILPAGLVWRRAVHLEEELTAARRPRVNLPLVYLSPARSGPGEGAPDVRLRLTAEPRWIVLALEPGGAPGAAYRATLADPGGETLWQSDAARADRAGTVVVSLPSSLLVPGDYRLALEPLPHAGEPAAPAVSFPFRVLPAAP